MSITLPSWTVRFALVLAAAPLSLSAQNGTLTGRITDAINGAAVVSATVEILGTDVGTLTDASGDFTVSVASATYSVLITATSYHTLREYGVRIPPGSTTVLDLQLTVDPLTDRGIEITVGRRPGEIKDAAAGIAVKYEREINDWIVTTPVQHLQDVRGVAIIEQNVMTSNVCSRGFCNIFSGALLTLVDNRIAGIPSLRANLLHFIPTTNDDLERMEFVLGPGSALYGPNTANGVLHLITKSPLTSQGTSVTLGGGEKGVWQGSFRTAHKLSENFAFKVSAQQLQGNDWRFIDPAEVAARAVADADPAAFVAERMARGLSQEDADLAFDRVGIRDYDGFDFRRQSVDVRADWGFGDDGRVIVNYGLSNVEGVDLTGLGAGQVEDWRYQFYQTRLSVDRLFAQVYLNTSDAGQSYLIRDGAPLVDRSRLFVGQIQHGRDLLEGRQDFTYGIDYFFTNPRTAGSINGRNESDDNITEFGGYILSTTALTERLDLVLAGRLDTHSRLDGSVFSPRAALVFEPSEGHNFRVTYNRAFSTPTTLNLFLDLSGGPAGALGQLGYRVQAQGNRDGFVFQNADGSLTGMRSPFNPGGAGQLIPADVPTLWQLGVGALEDGGADPALVGLLRSLSPTAADIGINGLDAGTGDVLPLALTGVPSVEALKESTTTTFEVGYQGLFNGWFRLAADLWYTKKANFVSPLIFRTPLLLLNATAAAGPDMVSYLVPILMGTGMSQAVAEATAAAVAWGSDGVPGGSAQGMADIPLGVVSNDQVEGSAPNLLLTFVNAGDVDMFGADFSVQAKLNDEWTVSSTASFVSDDYFDVGAVPTEVEGGIVSIALNAPKAKGTVSLAYRNVRAGLNAEARLRMTAGFPAESAGFVGTECVTGPTGALYEEMCVQGFQLVDLTLGYRIPRSRATLQVTVSNLFDQAYRSFVGVPEIGRFIMAQVRYDLF